MPSKDKYKKVVPTTAYLTDSQLEGLDYLNKINGSGHSENIRRALREYLLTKNSSRISREDQARAEVRGFKCLKFFLYHYC